MDILKELEQYPSFMVTNAGYAPNGAPKFGVLLYTYNSAAPTIATDGEDLEIEAALEKALSRARMAKQEDCDSIVTLTAKINLPYREVLSREGSVLTVYDPYGSNNAIGIAAREIQKGESVQYDCHKSTSDIITPDAYMDVFK